MVKPLLLALALAAPLAAHARPSAEVQEEVRHLLGFIEKSGCNFYRNGSWTDSKAAEAHVRMKYDYLSDRDQINTAAEFIDKAAAQSSFTGTPYQVRCGMSAPILSRSWLSDELGRYLGRGNKLSGTSAR